MVVNSYWSLILEWFLVNLPKISRVQLRICSIWIRTDLICKFSWFSWRLLVLRKSILTVREGFDVSDILTRLWHVAATGTRTRDLVLHVTRRSCLPVQATCKNFNFFRFLKILIMSRDFIQISSSKLQNYKITLFAGWVQQPAAVGRSVWCISLNLKMFVPLASHHHCWAGKWWYCRSTYQIKLSSNLLGSSHPIDHDVGQCISPFSPSTKTVAIESDTMEPV